MNIRKRRDIQSIHLNTLAFAAGQGSKEANKEIKKLSNELKRDEELSKGHSNQTPLNVLTDEELLNLL